MLEVFFCVFYHSLHRFLQCDWLNTMSQRARIPDRSIIASNFSKWEEKGPHMTLLFSRTSLVNHLMISKEYPVYVFLRLPHTLISKVVYLHHSHFRLLLLYVVLIVSTEIIKYVLLRGGQTIKYDLLPGHPDMKNPWYWKGLRFVCSGSRFGTGALDLQRFGNPEKGALDLISACFVLKLDINAYLWIHTWDHKNQKGIIQDFSIDILRTYPFCFTKNSFISILTHGSSKPHQPQFLNNKYVCITTYKDNSILLPLHLSIYLLWWSPTTTLFSLLIEKCVYTWIFIRKMCLHIHFYSKIGLTHTFLFPCFLIF